MNKTKIEYCDYTWNPVTGCLHGCEYCYARKIARRFCTNEFGTGDGILAPCGGDCAACSRMDGLEFIGNKIRYSHSKAPFPFGFLPTFYRHRLDEPQKVKKPQKIFVCSMADLFGEWVPDEWLEEVFKAIEKNPQHKYLFLTKNPKRYKDIRYSNNIWLGNTITRQKDFIREYGRPSGAKRFYSIEPILEQIRIPQMNIPKWIIVGAETGNRKDKVIPEKEWIDNIVSCCKEAGVPVFMKNSLKNLTVDDFIQEWPEGLR